MVFSNLAVILLIHIVFWWFSEWARMIMLLGVLSLGVVADCGNSQSPTESVASFSMCLSSFSLSLLHSFLLTSSVHLFSICCYHAPPWPQVRAIYFYVDCNACQNDGL